MAALLIGHHSHSISSLDPMPDFSKAWLSFWRSEGSWQSPSFVQNARNSNVQVTPSHPLALQCAAAATCYTVSQTSYKLTQFSRQFVRLVAIRSSSYQNSIASSILLSSAGAMQNGSTGTIPHRQKKLISPKMWYQHSRASLSSVCEGLQLGHVGLQMLTNMVSLESKLPGPEKHIEDIV